MADLGDIGTEVATNISIAMPQDTGSGATTPQGQGAEGLVEEVFAAE